MHLRVPLLDGWMGEAYERGRAYADIAPVRRTDRKQLDAFFREILSGVDGQAR